MQLPDTVTKTQIYKNIILIKKGNIVFFVFEAVRSPIYLQLPPFYLQLEYTYKKGLISGV